MFLVYVQFSLRILYLFYLHLVEDLAPLCELGAVAPGLQVLGQRHLPLLGALEQPLHRVHQRQHLVTANHSSEVYTNQGSEVSTNHSSPPPSA